MNVPVLIPAYNPDPNLFDIVKQLISLGFSSIIIVNDGSKPECMPVFRQLEDLENCYVLHHTVNLGKGRALKTGMNYFNLHFKDTIGVVTADADGQHAPEDILKVAASLELNVNNMILGVRKFDKQTPLRSLVGNTLTRLVISFLMGKKISDTQTGLRGIPIGYVPLLIKLNGEGYEFEINMLITTKNYNISIIEEQINTIYIDNNRSSHFNPLFDSMKIYFLMFRFASSSILAAVIDFILFAITYKITSNITTSIFIGRFTVAPLVNYLLNKGFVFHHKGNFRRALIKYYSLVIIMGVIASVLIKTVSEQFSLDVMLSKVLVESFLFIVSFTIQRDYIFSDKSGIDYLPGKE